MTPSCRHSKQKGCLDPVRVNFRGASSEDEADASLRERGAFSRSRAFSQVFSSLKPFPSVPPGGGRPEKPCQVLIDDERDTRPW